MIRHCTGRAAGAKCDPIGRDWLRQCVALAVNYLAMALVDIHHGRFDDARWDFAYAEKCVTVPLERRGS